MDLSYLQQGHSAKVYKTKVGPYCVAIRRITGRSTDENRKARFERIETEIRLHREIVKYNIPNIIRLHAYQFWVENNYWGADLMMEYAPGGDLCTLLQTKSLPELDCRRLFREILVGVHSLHTVLQRIHGDLSLENIVLVPNPMYPAFPYSAALIDMEFSTSLHNEEELRKSSGTLRYMSPEHFYKKKKISPKAATQRELWSLGVILFSMLTTLDLYSVDMKHEDSMKNFVKTYWIPSAKNPRPDVHWDSFLRFQTRLLPAEPAWVIRRCLSLDPSARLPIAKILPLKWFYGNF